MKYIIIVIILTFKFTYLFSEDNLIFFVDSAFKNNPKLNAERNNFKAWLKDHGINLE